MDAKNLSRRAFLGRAAAAVAAATVVRSASAAHHEVAMVDPESKQAKSLNYVEDASTLDPAVVTKYKPGSMCSNCQLYAGGDDHGGCAIFAGKNVKATGWCNVYAAKAG